MTTPRVVHTKVSVIPDGIDADQIQPSDWNADHTIVDLNVREKLTAARTYYVRTDGSDSNDGLDDSAAGAFLTIQKAVDVVADTIDLGGYVATIQVRDGTYTAGVSQSGAFVGAPGYVAIVGDPTTPSNVHISLTDATAFYVDDGAILSISGFKVTIAGASGSAVYASSPGTVVYVNDMEYAGGSSGWGVISSDTGGEIVISGTNTITGGGCAFFDTNSGGLLFFWTGTVTLTGTPAFTSSFAQAYVGGTIWSAGTFSGAATGKRFLVESNAVIMATSDTYFPGSTPGTVVSGGSYGGRSTREFLNANRTYYVRTDGSDSNDGLTDSAAGAFLTIQGALNQVQQYIDNGSNDVYIQVGAGTYTDPIEVTGAFVGADDVHLVGDTTTPSNVVIAPTGGNFGIACYNGAKLSVSGFKFTADTGGYCLYSSGAGAAITIEGKVEFGDAAGGGYHMVTDNQGSIFCSGISYTISGDAANHLSADTLGQIRSFNCTVTMSGTPAFDEFATCLLLGLIASANNTYTGATTGKRYNIETNSVIYVGFSGANYFPGDAAGTTATGGQYA